LAAAAFADALGAGEMEIRSGGSSTSIACASSGVADLPPSGWYWALDYSLPANTMMDRCCSRSWQHDVCWRPTTAFGRLRRIDVGYGEESPLTGIGRVLK